MRDKSRRRRSGAAINCAGCGAKANAEWDVCPDCGANSTTGEIAVSLSPQPALMAPVAKAGQPGRSVAALIAAVSSVVAGLSGLSFVALIAWALAMYWGIQGWTRYRSRVAGAALIICAVPFAMLVIFLVFGYFGFLG